MDFLLVTSGCLFQDLQLYDHIWLYDTIFYFHPRQRHINDCLSLYNAFPIFLGGWQHQPDLYDLEFLWISTHDCFKIWVSYDKPWSMDDWTNQKISAESVFSCQNLTIWPWKVFPFSILQWIPLTKPRLYNHHYCHVYSPKHGTHIVVAISLNAKNHQTLTDHTRLRFHVKFPECASINHPK